MCPAERPSIELKPGMEISWDSPRRGRVIIHPDCWKETITCQGIRTGGIYNGPYSIYDWYRDNL